ncbi:hypothetical protein WJ969_18240 [Achromobacter xylosoxidans]
MKKAVGATVAIPGVSGCWGVGKQASKVYGKLLSGLTYSADEVSKEGLLVLRSSNIQDGTLVLDKDLVFVNKTCPDDIQLRSGDIAICMSNGSKALVGKNAEFRGNYDHDLTVGAFCSIFRPSVEFSKLIFQTPKYTKFISVAIGGGNINNLKNSDLGSSSILFRSYNQNNKKSPTACLPSTS